MKISMLLLIFFFIGTEGAVNAEVIKFSGYEWRVKESENMGPGPNSWKSSNVWVDENGELHLKISYEDGKWHSAQVTSIEPLGYGTYEFYVKGRLDELDPNAVLGLYTYDNQAEDEYYREIDMEFAKWGNPGSKLGQYVIQPGGEGQLVKFDVTLNGFYTTHSFKWTPKQIDFKSVHGFYPSNDNRADTMYSHIMNTGVPKKGQETARINFWLHDGLPPQNGQEAEIVVSKFRFIPNE